MIKARNLKTFRHQMFKIVQNMRNQGIPEEMIKRDLGVSWGWLRRVRVDNPAGHSHKALLDVNLLTPEEREEYEQEKP